MIPFAPVKRQKPIIHRRVGDVEYVTIAGRVIIIDAEDLHHLEGCTLSIIGRGYVRLSGGNRTKPRPQIRLSRLLTNAPVGTMVDHISGDTLDNRKSNLRVCTRGENQYNTKKHSDGKNPYKGVTYGKSQWGARKWKSEIQINKKRLYIGHFLTPEAAAEAYNIKARELHGEFARLNVIGVRGETVSVKAST